MANWNEIWKNEKYPMWIENGGLARYWDLIAAQRFQRLSRNKDAPEREVEEFNLRQTDTVLDIGCGTGRLTIPIAKRVKYVYGIDVSKEMLKIAKEQGEKEGLKNIKLINANFETFDVNRIGKADVSVSYNSLGVYDIKNTLIKINNVTKRDVFIFTFTGKGEWLDERLAEIIYGEHQRNGPSSAEIIHNLLKEMGINPDFEVNHNIYKRGYDNIDDAVKNIMEFYRFTEVFKKYVEKFVKKNSVRDGKRCIMYHHRDIAKIHWRVENGR